MLGAMTDTVVHCRYCGQLLRESDHPGFRWVHVHSGAAYCAARSISDAARLARSHRRRRGRLEGEPLTMAEPE